jgi:uncharacterized protein YcfJ
MERDMMLPSASDLQRSRMTIAVYAGFLGAGLLGFPGCAHMNHAQSGGLMGTAVGGLAGAALGAQSGNAAAGALIGGVTGAMAGTVIGDSADAREERDIAMAQRDTAIAQAQYQAQQQSLTNFDLIRLAQNGVSDDVIINMIQSRGGQFDLTTDSVISLKTNGVSDRVLVAAQQARVVAPVAMPPAPDVLVVREEPSVVFAPAPVVIGHHWGHPRHFHHHHRRHHHRGGVDVFFGF